MYTIFIADLNISVFLRSHFVCLKLWCMTKYMMNRKYFIYLTSHPFDHAIMSKTI